MFTKNTLNTKLFGYMTSVLVAGCVAVSGAYAEDAVVTPNEEPNIEIPSEGGAKSNAQCDINVFNSDLFTEAGFEQKDDWFIGKWDTDLQNYVQAYSYKFKPKTPYRVMYEIDCSETNNVSQGFLELVLSNNETVAPSNIGVCNGGVAKVEFESPSGEHSVKGLRVNWTDSLLDDTVLRIRNVMVVPASVDTSNGSFIPFNPCASIATTDTVYRRSSAIKQRLNDVRSMITDLVTRSNENTADVAYLAEHKQTMPVSACEEGKKCLLVKNIDGKDAWYPILECEVEAFWESLGSSYSAPGVTVDAVCNNAVSSITGCSVSNNEWVSSWDKGFVMGVAKAVSVRETTPGTKISLAENVSSNSSWSTDQVCVCKVTGYNVRDEETGTYAGRVDVDAGNRWVVALRNTGYLALTDAGCVSQCARYGVGFGSTNGAAEIKSYYTSIGNSCSITFQQGTMCYYNGFMDNIIHNGTVGARGWVTNQEGSSSAQTYDACASGGYFAGNSWCNSSVFNIGNWITQFVSESNNQTSLGYVEGFAGFVTVPEGTAVGSVIDLADGVASWRPESGNNAIVCVVKRYKAEGTDSEHMVRFLTEPSLKFKAVVVQMNPNYSSSEYTYHNGLFRKMPAAELCSEYMSNVNNGASGQVFNWLMGDCEAN